MARALWELLNRLAKMCMSKASGYIPRYSVEHIGGAGPGRPPRAGSAEADFSNGLSPGALHITSRAPAVELLVDLAEQ